MPDRIVATNRYALAALVLREWEPPASVPFLERHKWRSWALGKALDMVDAGVVTGTVRKGQYAGIEIVLDRPAPPCPEWTPSDAR